MTGPSDKQLAALTDQRNHWIGEAQKYKNLYRYASKWKSAWFKDKKLAEAEVDRLKAALAETEAERNHLLDTFFATCPIEANHEHGVWCGSNWVATVKRADKAEADLRVLREKFRALADSCDCLINECFCEPILDLLAGA